LWHIRKHGISALLPIGTGTFIASGKIIIIASDSKYLNK